MGCKLDIKFFMLDESTLVYDQGTDRYIGQVKSIGSCASSMGLNTLPNAALRISRSKTKLLLSTKELYTIKMIVDGQNANKRVL